MLSEEQTPGVKKAVARFWRRLYQVRETKPEDISCPVCGYYCSGKGGVGCIDKPGLCGLAGQEE